MGIPDEKIFPHATGRAQNLVHAREGAADLVFHGSWFCPFVQRAWIVLEEKKLNYQWKEINPYKKDKEYLAINPKGLVPALTQKGVNVTESQVIMEYLEDISGPDVRMHPADPLQRAVARVWMDHIAKKIVPCFFRVLQAQESDKQKAAEKDLLAGITEFVEAMDPEGPYFFGNWFSMVDAFLIPWLIRQPAALKQFKGFEIPKAGSPVWDRWGLWMESCASRDSVKNTSSDQQHYLQILERYANDTAQSEAAKATRKGEVFT
ncbi:hypothetical protein WJX73_005676 [Symbiochloris irregularis]|uniref:Glutathione S-transferase n=1 Tax=Symbiochloris irregularis TaxID=706552 RepID=A0AAW1P9F2_9CHLO